jgi:hypothetical protein
MAIEFCWCGTLFCFLHFYVYRVMGFVKGDRCQMKIFVLTPHTSILHLLLPSSGIFNVLKCMKYVIVHSFCISWMHMWDSGCIAPLVMNLCYKGVSGLLHGPYFWYHCTKAAVVCSCSGCFGQETSYFCWELKNFLFTNRIISLTFCCLSSFEYPITDFQAQELNLYQKVN